MSLKHLSVQCIHKNINENKFEDFFLLEILLYFIWKYTYLDSHEQVQIVFFIHFLKKSFMYVYMVLSDLKNVYRTHFLLNLQYM